MYVIHLQTHLVNGTVYQPMGVEFMQWMAKDPIFPLKDMPNVILCHYLFSRSDVIVCLFFLPPAV